MFAYFSKKWQFYKKKHFSSQPPKKHYFSGLFFEIFFFHFFHVFSFSFSNIKKTKTKSAHFFFENPFFDTLTNCQKIFSHTYTLFVFFKIPKKHYKTGEKQAKKNLGPSFDATLDQVLTQKTPNLGPGFDSTAYMYIYIYIYIYGAKTSFSAYNKAANLILVGDWQQKSQYKMHLFRRISKPPFQKLWSSSTNPMSLLAPKKALFTPIPCLISCLEQTECLICRPAR